MTNPQHRAPGSGTTRVEEDTNQVDQEAWIGTDRRDVQ